MALEARRGLYEIMDKLNKEAARSKQELIAAIQKIREDVNKQVAAWKEPTWAKEFERIADMYIAEGLMYQTSDKSSLLQDLISRLTNMGSQTGDATVSLVKKLRTDPDLALKYIDLLVEKINAEVHLKELIDGIEKRAATYDSWETDKLLTKQLSERDDYGGDPYPHDYPEISSDVRPWSLPKHQQELWQRFKEWWEKKWVGREVDEMPKSDSSGLGSPYVAWRGSPAEVNAMPAMKEGELKKEAIDEYADHHISLTFEFMQDELKVSATWDKQDMPPGLNEEQTLARIIQSLEKKLPEAFNNFKQARVEDVDLINRMVGIIVPIGERHGRQPSRNL